VGVGVGDAASVLKSCEMVCGSVVMGMLGAMSENVDAADRFVVAAWLLVRAIADGMLIRGNELRRIKIAVAMANAGRRSVCECDLNNEGTGRFLSSISLESGAGFSFF
jgi:hypothetical protein